MLGAAHLVARALALAATASFGIASATAAQEGSEPKEKGFLEIVDVTGKVVQTVGMPDVDYTNYPMVTGIGIAFYKPDHESAGLRVRKGEATVTADWSRIKSVQVSGSVTKTGRGSLDGRITFVSGEYQVAKLVEPSRGGLAVETSLGRFRIPLRHVRTMFCKGDVAAGWKPWTPARGARKLQLVHKSGRTTELSGVFADYSPYRIAESEASGIRAYYGAGEVTIWWGLIRRLELTAERLDAGGGFNDRTSKLRGVFLLEDGTKQVLNLVLGELRGKSADGPRPYTMDLLAFKTIVPLKEDVPGK